MQSAGAVLLLWIPKHRRFGNPRHHKGGVILLHVYACMTVPSLPEVGLVGAGDQWDVDFLGRDDSHLHGSTSFILKVQTHKTLSNRYRPTSPNFTFFFSLHASGYFSLPRVRGQSGYGRIYYTLSPFITLHVSKKLSSYVFSLVVQKIISNFTAPSQRLGDSTSRPGASGLTKNYEILTAIFSLVSIRIGRGIHHIDTLVWKKL